MSLIDESAEIPLPCPGCGHKTPKSLAWLKTKPDAFECAGCDRTVKLEPEGLEDLIRSLKTIDDSVDELRRTFDRINKRSKR